MPISIEADSTLPQGYLKVNGVTAATVTTTGLTTASLQDNAVTTAKVVNAAITPAKLSQPYTLATAQASTSGTAIDFTGIPSWAKKITIMLVGVSTNGTSTRQLQIGDSGGFETTNYTAGVMEFNDNATLSSGFPLNVPAGNTAAETLHGFVVLSNVTGNTWVANGTIHATARAVPASCAGSKTLSAVLDRVRITTVNGTDTFDAGTINIAYEG